MPDIPFLADRGSSLGEVVGDGRAVLYFMRSAACPICTAHARTLAGLAEAGALGDATVVLVTPGGAEDVATVRRRIPSPAVQVWASGTGHADVGLGRFLLLQHSGTFVLDGRRVRWRRTSANPAAGFSRQQLLDALG
jgi:hypothetical protein